MNCTCCHFGSSTIHSINLLQKFVSLHSTPKSEGRLITNKFKKHFMQEISSNHRQLDTHSFKMQPNTSISKKVIRQMTKKHQGTKPTGSTKAPNQRFEVEITSKEAKSQRPQSPKNKNLPKKLLKHTSNQDGGPHGTRCRI